MKIQIVNANDELIGVKERSEIDFQNDIYRVSALWVTNSKGETLLAKRAAIKRNDPNKWGPAVAGTIDEGETYDENIYKEADEEIGLMGVEFTKIKKTRITYPRNYFCQWYSVTLDRDPNSFKLQDEELAEVVLVYVEPRKTALR